MSLSKDMGQVVSEERANRTSTALITAEEFAADPAIAARIDELVVPLAGQPHNKGQPLHQLLPQAAKSFRQMEAAAAKDGIKLTILSSYRPPWKQASLHSKNANTAAVAKFSEHQLGVAIDLKLSVRGQAFHEASTADMAEVVAMRTSPVHKWMVLHGKTYGWHPYNDEPWHWYHNPEEERTKTRQLLLHGGSR